MGSKEALLALSPLGGAMLPLAGAALSDATKNNIFDAVGMQDYISDDEKEKRKRQEDMANQGIKQPGMKKGGKVKSKVSSASKRADGIAQRGKTRGKIC